MRKKSDRPQPKNRAPPPDADKIKAHIFFAAGGVSRIDYFYGRKSEA
jgi:hypothetical protein